MKLALLILPLALLGCSTMDRQPAGQSTSPEIQAKQREVLDASPVSAGDALKFNDDARFEVGQNKLSLGSTSGYPFGLACSLEVEPPRGEFVQNFVPKGMVLTVTGMQMTPGLPDVEIHQWRTSSQKLRAIVDALRERGYTFTAPIDYNQRETEIRLKGRPLRAVYPLSGSRLRSQMVCQSFESSYSSNTVYDVKDITRVDEQIAAMKAGATVGQLRFMLLRTSANMYGTLMTPIELVPGPRSQMNYQLMPINLWQQPRRFEDVRLNSI